MEIKLKIVFFSMLFCLSALARDDQFEIKMYINGILQPENVLIKDGDLCEAFIFDKLNNIEIKNACTWRLLFKDSNSDNEVEKAYDDYVEDSRLRFKMQPSFTGRVFCDSKLSKYKDIVEDSWGCYYSQHAYVKCDFLFGGKRIGVVKDISFDVVPTLPEIKVHDIVYSGDYNGEKNYDINLELYDGNVDMAGFVLVDEECEGSEAPTYYYDFIDEGTKLPCIKKLSDICEHVKWCFFNENDYGVSVSDWMDLNTSGISQDNNSKSTISLQGNVLKISSLTLLKEIEVYSPSGTLVCKENNIYDYECILPCGIYILRIADCKKITTKNIKV